MGDWVAHGFKSVIAVIHHMQGLEATYLVILNLFLDQEVLNLQVEPRLS